MSKLPERECTYNVEDSFESRFFSNNCILYVGDHYWVLEKNDCFEFYLHPNHILGKFRRRDLPQWVLRNIRNQTKRFTPNDFFDDSDSPAMPQSPAGPSFPALDEKLRIGNWFYAMGQYYYVTMNGRVFESTSGQTGAGGAYLADRVYPLKNLEWRAVYDMMRMTPSTRTHHYLRSVFDLGCFTGKSPSPTVRGWIRRTFAKIATLHLRFKLMH